MKSITVLIPVFLLACSSPREHLPVCQVDPPIDSYGNPGKYGMTFYTDVEAAKQCASSTGRKILLMFMGYATAAVEGQEWKILRETEVREIIDDQFILVVLYVDNPALIPVTDSSETGDSLYPVQTIGSRWSALQVRNFETNSQPYYVVTDTSLKAIVPGLGYTKDAEVFSEMLSTSLEKH